MIQTLVNVRTALLVTSQYVVGAKQDEGVNGAKQQG